MWIHGSHGYSCDFMVLHGSSWPFMVLHGSKWMWPQTPNRNWDMTNDLWLWWLSGWDDTPPPSTDRSWMSWEEWHGFWPLLRCSCQRASRRFEIRTGLLAALIPCGCNLYRDFAATLAIALWYVYILYVSDLHAVCHSIINAGLISTWLATAKKGR